MLGATYRAKKGSMGIVARYYHCITSMSVEPLLTSAMTLAFDNLCTALAV